MRLVVALPNRIQLDVTVTKVSAEGVHGAFTMLPHHLDYVVVLEPGILSYNAEDGEERYVAIDRGSSSRWATRCGSRPSPPCPVTGWKSWNGPYPTPSMPARRTGAGHEERASQDREPCHAGDVRVRGGPVTGTPRGERDQEFGRTVGRKAARRIRARRQVRQRVVLAGHARSTRMVGGDPHPARRRPGRVARPSGAGALLMGSQSCWWWVWRWACSTRGIWVRRESADDEPEVQDRVSEPEGPDSTRKVNGW
jgi:hypothetical protein